jgi:UTP-glucose-1-phosphate uridylyltransferase
LIGNGGFGGVNMNEFVLYDSGEPINWLKSQIDHALRREDLKDDMENWIKKRISEENI